MTYDRVQGNIWGKKNKQTIWFFIVITYWVRIGYQLFLFVIERDYARTFEQKLILVRREWERQGEWGLEEGSALVESRLVMANESLFYL